MDPERENQTQTSAGSGRPAAAVRTEPAERATPRRHPGGAQRNYTAEQKLAILRAFAASPDGMRDFCAKQGLTTKTLCTWRKRLEEEGPAGLKPRPNPRNRGKSRGPFTPAQRREAVEAFVTSGMLQGDFCRVWGIGRSTLGKWLKRYEEEGPQGLETRRPQRKAPPVNALSESTKEAVRETKRKYPSFGLRRIRDWLFRHEGKKVSASSVKNVLVAADLHDPPKPKKKRRRKALPRRFERSKPRELWQSDITSYVLPRSGRRLYLTVFLDDYSRYIVSWHLATHQKGDLVIEALLEGIARFGKPREVLTDQGRQYFAWRGKSRFQKLLHQEGIQHVVARAKHPQTLGKCERLWQTIENELWVRVRMNDLVEARVRMGHWIRHYNHFRPHQGIGGAVPADRFFLSEDAMRETLEKSMRDELGQALMEPKREAVYLFGRVGEKSVSLHGEGGRIVVQTPDGDRRELTLEALGGAGIDGTEAEEDAEADHLQGAGADADGRAGAVADGDGGGARACAPSGDGGAGDVAREEDEAGGGAGTGGEAAQGLAAQPDGGVGYGGGLTEAAPEGWWPGGAESTGRRPAGASEADQAARGGGVGSGAAGVAGAGSSSGEGGEPWQEGGARKSEEESDEGWWREESLREDWE